MGNVKELNSENFDKFIDGDNTIIDFYAEWCGPCQMLKPVLEEVAKEANGIVKIGKVNVDDNTELAQRFEVRSIPALIFFKDRKQVHRMHGAVDKEKLLEEIDEQF
jgi:thioredoxin 1